jgi:hypothetical protein
VAIVQSAKNQVFFAAAIPFPLTGVAAGNLLVIQVGYWYAAGGAGQAAPAAPAGWTAAIAPPSAAYLGPDDSIGMAVYFKSGVTAGDYAPVITLPAGSFAVGAISEWPAATYPAPVRVDQSAFNTGNASGTATFSTGTTAATTSANQLVLYTLDADETSALANTGIGPSAGGITELYRQLDATFNEQVVLAYQEATATGTQGATWTKTPYAGAQAWMASVVTLTGTVSATGAGASTQAANSASGTGSVSASQLSAGAITSAFGAGPFGAGAFGTVKRSNPAPAQAVAITGTGARTQAPNTASGTATVGSAGVTGTGASTQAANTASGTATVGTSLSAGVIVAAFGAGPFGAGAFGVVKRSSPAPALGGIAGAGASTQAANTAAGIGSAVTAASGAGAASQAANAAAGVGQALIAGTSARTQAANTAAGAASIGAAGLTGAGAATQAVNAAAGVGQALITGSGASVQGVQLATGAAQIIVSGLGLGSDAADTAAGAGLVFITGTGAAAQGRSTAAGVGLVYSGPAPVAAYRRVVYGAEANRTLYGAARRASVASQQLNREIECPSFDG